MGEVEVVSYIILMHLYSQSILHSIIPYMYISEIGIPVNY